jgi:GT2 family glycosyltransferase
MQNNLISIIIINYRQKTFLVNCINSIYENIKSYPFEIVIINNSQEDYISLTEYKNLTVVPNENKGFSQANNLGVKHSLGEYLLFLNADTIVKNDFAGELIKHFENIEFGAVGLKLLNTDGTFQISSYEENTFTGEIRNKKLEKKFSQENISFINKIEAGLKNITKVEWVSGAALFMKRKIFDDIGGFDERYFLFYEDADICKRFSDKGLSNYFYPFSEIIHLKGENVNKEFEIKTYYFSKQSQLLYYKLHNNIFDRIILRIYLFSKFLLLSLFTFKKINIEILKSVMGIKK